MTKYATLTQYQPYIDVIRRDLSLPDDLVVNFTFTTFTGAYGGYTNWRGTYANVKLSKHSGKDWTLRALMHEFMHVQQYYNGRLGWVFVPAEYHKSGRLVKNTNKWMQSWYGKLYNALGASNNLMRNTKYMNQPWELEAVEYQNTIDKLFPDLTMPKTYLGEASDGTKFYKRKS